MEFLVEERESSWGTQFYCFVRNLPSDCSVRSESGCYGLTQRLVVYEEILRHPACGKALLKIGRRLSSPRPRTASTAFSSTSTTKPLIPSKRPRPLISHDCHRGRAFRGAATSTSSRLEATVDDLEMTTTCSLPIPCFIPAPSSTIPFRPRPTQRLYIFTTMRSVELY
jgi:hypothetical protein